MNEISCSGVLGNSGEGYPAKCGPRRRHGNGPGAKLAGVGNTLHAQRHQFQTCGFRADGRAGISFQIITTPLHLAETFVSNEGAAARGLRPQRIAVKSTSQLNETFA
ncbi:hypothetical protein ACJJTC_019738 [Scirpophaga incertulas]